MTRRLFALVALAVALSFAAVAEARHEVLYFYRNYCEYCAPEEDFAERFEGVTGLKLADCDFTAWNVVRSDGLEAWRTAQREYQIAKDALPTAIVDGVVYQGYGEMDSALSVAALQWHDTLDSEILFVYTPACESCAVAEEALDALPETVTLQRGDTAIESAVVVRRVDASAQPDYVAALFKAYGVPDDARVTPAVFYADRYLTGAESIAARLVLDVTKGRAVGGVPEVEVKPSDARATIAASIVAGLVAGLNTCALSMLLLFLSLLMDANRRAVPAAVSYLVAKFACYLLIGFVLTELFQRLNPTFLKPLARWSMTVLGGALAVVTVSDAINARRGRLGAIRNQLPGGLRGGLRRTIKRITTTRWLIPMSALLGCVVAGGEFLCAGQLYLMRLITAAERGEGALSLIVYCAAFIAPSAVLCAVVLAARSHLEASGFFARHMSVIKLATACVMVALIVWAWMV